MQVGFVGLGLMGTPMARNLLEAGHDLHVASRNPESLAELRALGATVHPSVAGVAAASEIFCACRVTPEHSIETFVGGDGVAAHGQAGLLCIDFSTIDPGTSRRIGAELAERGIGYIDAPISGGPDGAAARTLSIIAGGSEPDIARARPVLDAIGKGVFHMGPVGAGVTAKLCNNLITITAHALIAEAFVFGAKSGIDPRRLYEVLNSSSAHSRTLQRVVPNHFLPRNFTAASTVVTVMKDLACAIEAARAVGVSLQLPATALACYEEAIAQGHADDDIAAVILPMEKAAGVEVGPA
jgi:3-hydroxyisobutyrate dehydrogenase